MTNVPRVPGPTTKLAAFTAGGASKASPAAPPPPSKMRKLASGRRGMPRDLPLLGRVYIELPGAKRWQAIEAEVREEMKRAGFELTLDVATNIEAELAMRVLTEAVRDDDDRAVPFGTLADWQDLDNDVLNLAWRAYEDVRAELDPVAVANTADDLRGIAAALKKKDPVLLRSYGAARLALYMLSSESQQLTSPTPSSSTTESPED